MTTIDQIREFTHEVLCEDCCQKPRIKDNPDATSMGIFGKVWTFQGTCNDCREKKTCARIAIPKVS